MKKTVKCTAVISKIPQKKQRADFIVNFLKEYYPTVQCGLDYKGDPYKLLVMARLSAQCTDKRVNLVSIDLFKEFPTLESMANADQNRVEELIKSCGVYKMKAKNIIEMCRLIKDEFNGEIPRDKKSLLQLPGVGSKIANLLLGDLYNIPSIVADTHCIRISNRFGFTKKADPKTTEESLTKLIEKNEQTDFCHRIVEFGREFCSAASPKCDYCPLKNKALSKGKTEE